MPKTPPQAYFLEYFAPAPFNSATIYAFDISPYCRGGDIRLARCDRMRTYVRCFAYSASYFLCFRLFCNSYQIPLLGRWNVAAISTYVQCMRAPFKYQRQSAETDENSKSEDFFNAIRCFAQPFPQKIHNENRRRR